MEDESVEDESMEDDFVKDEYVEDEYVEDDYVCDVNYDEEGEYSCDRLRVRVQWRGRVRLPLHYLLRRRF